VNCVTLSRGGAARVVREIRNARRTDNVAPKESSAWSLTRLRKVIGQHELTLITTTA
jgi:hypothetical protein